MTDAEFLRAWWGISRTLWWGSFCGPALLSLRFSAVIHVGEDGDGFLVNGRRYRSLKKAKAAAFEFALELGYTVADAKPDEAPYLAEIERRGWNEALFWRTQDELWSVRFLTRAGLAAPVDGHFQYRGFGVEDGERLFPTLAQARAALLQHARDEGCFVLECP